MDSRDDKGNDLVRFVLLATKEAVLRNGGRFTDEVALAVEQRARDEYGGEEHYIARRQPSDIRHEVYRREIASGLSVKEVARRHGVSTRTVQRAVSIGDKFPLNLSSHIGEDTDEDSGSYGD